MQLRRVLLGFRLGRGLLRVLLRGGNGGVLHVLVEGGDHLEAATLHLGVAVPEVRQFLLHLGHQESLGATVAVGDGHLGKLGEGGMSRVVISLGDVAIGQHLIEDVLVATQEPFPALLTGGRVEAGWVVEDGCESRGLGQAEFGGRLEEVRLGGSLDAVGAPTEVDGVEIALQDLLLGHLPTHLHGQDQLADLAARGAFGTQVKDLDVLLGDGGAALHVTAPGNGPQATEHAGQGEPRIGEEGGVLSRHHRVLHHLRHLVVLEGDAVLHGQGAELLLSVVVINEGGIGGEVAVRVR